MRCRSARLLLQVPSDLRDVQRAELDAHLAACAACRERADADLEVDRLVRASLPTGAPSVRPAVHARIAVRRKPRRPHPSIALFPVAAVVALAVLLSGLLPGPSHLQPVRAAWHLPRTGVGYPLGIDAARPSHLLAGAWGGVYESWNGGDSWRPLAPLPANLVVRAVAVDAAHPRRYVVATKHSIFVSTDAGRHWAITAADLTGAMNMFLLQDRVHPATFYVGPSILWKSNDGAMRFHPAGTGTVFAPDGIQALAIAPNGDLVTGIWAGGVAVSTDGGRTWHRRARNLARNVMDVAAAPTSLWAATDQGLYRSSDTGRTWSHVALPGRRPLFTTSVLAVRSLLLAGGNGAVYRSSDGGRHWTPAMEGLPLDPYVAGLVADPAHPSRVYLSLDGDGLYRSDDGGAHWQPIDKGLPLDGPVTAAPLLLFRRTGALWITDARGTDPGVLTVERNVRLAALAPDGAEVAYLAGTGTWAVRVLGAGGSAARTAASGTGSAPRSLLWSPNSTLLVISGAGNVQVTDLGRTHATWPFDGRILAWTPDGHALLAWAHSRLTRRSPLTGAIVARVPGQYPIAPLVSPNGRAFAWTTSGMLTIETRFTHTVRSTCRPLAWSLDNRRLLLHCPDGFEVRAATGRVLARGQWDARSWSPDGGHLLVFRSGDLWSGNLSTGRLHLLVRNAKPVSAAR